MSFNEYIKLTEEQALEKLNSQGLITKKEARDILFSLCDAMNDRVVNCPEKTLSPYDYYRGELNGMISAIKLLKKLK